MKFYFFEDVQEVISAPHVCVVSCGSSQAVLPCELQGGFLRAGLHVGQIRPLLPAAPPALEQDMASPRGCRSLLTLLAGGA